MKNLKRSFLMRIVNPNLSALILLGFVILSGTLYFMSQKALAIGENLSLDRDEIEAALIDQNT